MTDSNNPTSNIVPSTEIKSAKIIQENKNKPESENTIKKAEEPKVEIPKTEEPKVGQVNITAPSVEIPKIAEQKSEQIPKVEEPLKTEIPNVGNNPKIEEQPKINDIPKEIDVKKDEVNIEKLEKKIEESNPNPNVGAITNENINKINHEALNPIAGAESNNILESNEIKGNPAEEQKDNIDIPMSNMEFNNFNNDVMDFNAQLMSKEFDKNSFTYSSSGGDPNLFLGRKRQFDRYEEELICKEICEDKKSSPSLVMLCKIIEEFTYGTVLDTLLKSTLNQDSKLDSLLQGLIDSEGINKVILMLLKFKQ